MASDETREDIVQLTVAAYDAAPDAARMRELEAIVDGGGSLLDAAEALASGERWEALYPSSQTPAEFSDAWLETLLPGVSAELLAFGRTVVVPHIEAGNGPAGLVLAAQDFLSAPGVPADFAAFARGFLERSASAMEELVEGETAEDLVQLAVAAYGAAPGAALMGELEAVVDGGGSLPEAAGALVENERWEALYPSSQTPAEFSDAWLAVLLPGVGADLLAVGRAVVVPHIEGGGAPAELVLLAQGFLSAPVAPAGFADFAEAFLNRSEVAAEHSAVRMLDGTAAELSEALASVTDDDATVQAAIDALDDPMSGGQMPGDQMPGDQMPGGGGQTPSGGGGSQTPSGGGGGGSQTPSGGGGGGSQAPSGGGGGGSQTPSGGGSQTPSGGGSQTPSGGGSQTPSGGGGGGSQTPSGGGGGGSQTPSGGGGGSGQTPSGGGSQTPSGGGGGGSQTPSGGGGGSGQTPVPSDSRDTKDAQGRVVLSEFDDDEDGTYDRAEAYGYGAGNLVVETVWYDDWALEADGAGKGLAGQTADRALTVADGDGDGTGDSRQHDTYAADGETIVESLFDDDNAADGGWERAEGYEHDADGELILKKTGGVEGADPESATVDYDKAEIYIQSKEDGATQTRFFDAYDGTSDFAALEAGAPDRIHFFGVELDSDGSDDARYEKLDAGGRAVEVLFDIDGDGTDRAEAYEYGAADLVVKTTWYDEWAVKADGAAKDLAGQTIDRVLTVADENGDGTGESSRHDKYDDAGALVVESLFDDGLDGVDRAEAYVWDADGRKTETRFFDPWTGTFDLSGAAPDRIHIWTYAAAAADKRQLSFSEDFDGDGNVDIKTAVSYHGADDILAARMKSYDDGSGGETADDGEVDKITLEDFNARGKVELIRFDDDADGTYDRAEDRILGGSDDRLVRTDFYDDWDDAMDAAAQQAARSAHFLQDYDGDGAKDDGKTETFDDAGRAVRIEFDYGADGTVDRIETYTWSADAADMRWLTKLEDADGDGTADLKTEVAYHGATDTVETRRTDYDDGAGTGAADDGTVDRSTLETFDIGAVLVSTKHDDDGDGVWDRTEENGARYMRDGSGRITLVEFDDDKDGTYDRAEAYEHGAGDLVVKTTWYDEWALKADGAAKDLAGQTIDRVLTVEDENGDGTGESSRRDKYDAAGALVVESLFDDGLNGVDRAEAYAWDADGRKTETRFFEPWTGTFDLSDGTPGRIHGWTYNAVDAADKRWLSFSEDFDGDGTADLKTAVTYHGTAVVLATRRTDYDDGTGGKAIDDGTVDKSVLESFDSGGAPLATKHDDDGNSGWDRTADVNRHMRDGEGRITLSEVDVDGDGTYDRAVAYEYGSGNLAVKTTWYDSWAVEPGKDGAGKALADQTIDRALTVADGDQDGAGDSRQHDTYGDDGATIVRSLFDADAAGGWDRAEGYERDGGGLVLKKTGAVIGTDADPGEDAVAYVKAEIYLRDGAAVSEIRFFDEGDYDGSADFDGLTAPGVLASRIHYFGLSLDDVGAKDDKRYDTLNGDGQIVRSVFDYGPDAGLDAIEDYEAHESADAGARVTVKRIGAASGADPAVPVIVWESRERYTYDDGSSERRSLIEYDGAGGGTAAYTRAERYTWDGAANTKIEFFDEGGWTPGAANVADRVHHFGKNLNDDPAADVRRDALDAEGRVVLSVFEDGADGAFWAVAWEYGVGDLKTKTTWYDSWTDGAAAADQTIDRVLTKTDEEPAGSPDGTAESRRHETWVGGKLVRSLFDTDNAADGGWERAEDHEYQDGTGERVLTKTGDMVVGADPESASVAAWSAAEIHILDDAGTGTVETRFFDAGDYDGSAGFDDLTAEGVVASRIHHFATDHNGDGADDIRRDTLDGEGRVILSVFENGTDDTDQWGILREYGVNDLETRTVWYDDWNDALPRNRQTISRELVVTDDVGGSFGTGPPDGVGETREHRTYEGGRNVQTLIDFDDNGTWDIVLANEFSETGEVILFKQGFTISGADPETAAIEYHEASIYLLDAGGRKTETRFFDRYDGSSDYEALVSETSVPSRIYYFHLGLDDDGNDDDARYDTLDAAGRVTVSIFDIDKNGPERAEAYEYDDYGRKTETRVYDPLTGTVNFALTDATQSGRHTYVYSDDKTDPRWMTFSKNENSGAGDANFEYVAVRTFHVDGGVATKTVRLDDGMGEGSGGDVADDGSFDRKILYTYNGSGGLISIQFDDDSDGSYETTQIPGLDPRDVIEGGNLVQREFDVDRDGAYDRAERYTYSGGVKTRADLYDDWLVDAAGGAKALTEQTSIRYATYGRFDAGAFKGEIEKIFFFDNGTDDATVNRYHEYGDDGGGTLILAGKGFDTDGDGTIDWTESYTYDSDDRIASATYRRDSGYNTPTAATVERIDRYEYDGSGELEKVRRDFDGDGTVDLVLVHTREDGRIVETAFHRGAAVEAVPDWTEAHTYNKQGRIALTEYHDGGTNDGTPDRIEEYAYNDEGLIVAVRFHDDGDADTDADETAGYVWNDLSDNDNVPLAFDSADDGALPHRWILLKDGDGAVIGTLGDPRVDGVGDVVDYRMNNGGPGLDIGPGVVPRTINEEQAERLTIFLPEKIGTTVDKGVNGTSLDDVIVFPEPPLKTGGAGAGRHSVWGGEGADVFVLNVHRPGYASANIYIQDFDADADMLRFVGMADLDGDGDTDYDDLRGEMEGIGIRRQGEPVVDRYPGTLVKFSDGGNTDAFVFVEDAGFRTQTLILPDSTPFDEETGDDDDKNDRVKATSSDLTESNVEFYSTYITPSEAAELKDHPYDFGAGGEVVLARYDGDPADGSDAYDRAVAYEYYRRTGDGFLEYSKISWYDGWDDAMGLDQQHPDRVLDITDEDSDGTWESRRHDAYGTVGGGRVVVRSVFDEDSDDSWDRAEAYDYDAANDNRLHFKRIGSIVGVGDDPADGWITYNRAERYHYDGAGEKTTVDYWDSWDDSMDIAGNGSPDRTGDYVPPGGRDAGEPAGPAAGPGEAGEHTVVGSLAGVPSHDDWSM